MITRIEVDSFTVFKRINIKFTSGINIFTGLNGVGKTHLIKTLYSACNCTSFSKRLAYNFSISEEAIGHLVNHRERCAKVKIYQKNGEICASLISHSQFTTTKKWTPIRGVLISMDRIFDSEFLCHQKNSRDKTELLMSLLQKLMDNKKVTIRGRELFLKDPQTGFDSLLSKEGICGLGLLWLALWRGALSKNSILFWDLPETNLNPRVLGPLTEIFLELQRIGIQIFLATHSYVLLKEVDLRAKSEDKILFHSLYKNTSGEIQCQSTNDYLKIHPNPIIKTFLNLYNRDIRRCIHGFSKEVRQNI